MQSINRFLPVNPFPLKSHTQYKQRFKYTLNKEHMYILPVFGTFSNCSCTLIMSLQSKSLVLVVLEYFL